MTMATSEDEVRHARDALTRYEEARGPGMDWPYWAGYLCDSLEQLLGTAAAEREDTARELRDTRAALAAVLSVMPRRARRQQDGRAIGRASGHARRRASPRAGPTLLPARSARTGAPLPPPGQRLRTPCGRPPGAPGTPPSMPMPADLPAAAQSRPPVL